MKKKSSLKLKSIVLVQNYRLKVSEVLVQKYHLSSKVSFQFKSIILLYLNQDQSQFPLRDSVCYRDTRTHPLNSLLHTL